MAPPTEEQAMLKSVLKYEVATGNPLRPGENRSHSYFETLSQQRDLPIMQVEIFNKFLRLYKDNQVVVVAAETGSGDSIQLTKRIMYIELDKGLQVVCTQPSPDAARELGERVSAELEVTFGEQVGVQYRKYNKTRKHTRLKFVTDGMLLQQIGNNPTMVGCSCVILDLNEQTINVDPLLALLKKALALRSDLKVVIMSAAESEKSASYFNVPQIFKIERCSFPVQIQYINEADPDYCETAFHLVQQIHETEDPGDILVFLASKPQVNRAVKKLRGAIPDMETFPLHGRLSEAEKAKALCSGEKRRCVITTNIAESSVAVDGIVYVVGRSMDILIGVEKLISAVDCGVEMESVFNPRVKMNTIQAAPISKSTADQRAACAGRSQPGLCYRLYTMKTYDETLLEVSPPSLLKDCFTTAMLALKSAGIDSVGTFDFLDPQKEEVYLRGLEDLKAMSLIDENGTVTRAGKAAATLFIDLTWHNAFEEAIRLGCLSELIDIAALASVKNPIILKPHETQHADGASRLPDHLAQLNIMYTYLNRHRDMSSRELATWCHEAFLSQASLHEALDLRLGLVGWCKANFRVSEISFLTPGDKDYHDKIRKALAKRSAHHATISDVPQQPDQHHKMEDPPKQ
ncbi:ATP-binding protein PRP16 [Fusarium circinatum]|uniref:ATP-binding protein PRP16 n=1 Tax=Fusarium circinatum TaxID=48490 RepID=A0A8H5SV56_FUSCI|nr:ATP-binding protein PRP16 [Fusarium circinatum]